MKLKNAILLFVIFCSINVFGQLAGYMGKRFSVGYSNYFSPSAINPNVNSTGLGFNSTHCVNIDYVIKNRTSLCASIQFYKSGIVSDDAFTYYYNNGSYYDQGYAYYKPTNNSPMLLKTTNISIGFKFFGRDLIAPVGKYKKLEMIFLLDNITYQKNAFTVNSYYGGSNNIAYTSIGKGEYNFKSFALAYTIGRQRILFDKLILDTGVRFGVSPNFVLRYVLDDFFSYSSDKAFEEQLQQNTQLRVFGAQLVNLHIGLSFLAF